MANMKVTYGQNVILLVDFTSFGSLCFLLKKHATNANINKKILRNLGMTGL